MKPSVVHVGCSGWAASQAKYFREFDAIEIQQTFYDPPRVSTLERWRAAAPEEFHFTIKCFQFVTHEATSATYRRLRRPRPKPGTVGSFRDTPEVRAAWEETRAAARTLRADLVLLQTPASFTPTAEHLKNLRTFARWARRRGAGIALVFEPRGPAWEAEAADRLCAELGLLRACDPFATDPPQPRAQRLAYFRLHGIGGYRYTFTEADLARLADIARRYRETWVFFNNMAMWTDARRFKRLLASTA